MRKEECLTSLPIRLTGDGRGEEIRVVSPSGPIGRSEGRVVLGRNLKYVREVWGVPTNLGKNVYKREYDLAAGTPTQRMADIKSAVRKAQVRVVWSTAGGYDAMRVWPVFDDKRVAEVMHDEPKMFVGYSDICLLLLAVYAKFGAVSVMAPTFFGLRKWQEKSIDELRRMLFGESVEGIGPEAGWSTAEKRKRVVEGTLIASNLGTLTHCFGNGFDPLTMKPGPKILAIEELKVPKNEFARYLDQTRNHPNFVDVRGVILGRTWAVEEEPDGYVKWGEAYSQEDLVRERLGVPVAVLPEFGHVSDDDDKKLLERTGFGRHIFYPLPTGVRSRLTVGPKECKLEYLSPICK